MLGPSSLLTTSPPPPPRPTCPTPPPAGYRLAPEELERLLDQLDTANTGKVAKSQLAASQVRRRGVACAAVRGVLEFQAGLPCCRGSLAGASLPFALPHPALPQPSIVPLSSYTRVPLQKPQGQWACWANAVAGVAGCSSKVACPRPSPGAHPPAD